MSMNIDKDDNSFEEVVRIPFPGNRIILCRISLGANIVVGPGPRPRTGVAILAQDIDESHVLTIETEMVSGATANISVGPGPK